MFAPDYTPQPTDEQWAKVPLSLIKDTKLTDGAKLLYAYIAAVNAPKSEPPRQAKIAADLEITPSAVTKRVKELVARDWLIVWTVYSKGLRYNAYQTFQTTNECRKYREEHLGINYVNFNDKLKERKVRLGNRKSDNSSSSIIELVQASNQANDETGSSDRHSSSASISYVFADEYITDNTSISNEIDMRPDQKPQDMVSDTATVKANLMVDSDLVGDRVLEETHEEHPTPVALPPSPAVVVVKATGRTVVKPRNPLFDSIAWLQFGVAAGEDVPSGTAGRVSKIEKIIVDGYKKRQNVTALSPHEREGLAGIHSKFWTWYTTVRYPPKNGQQIELRSSSTFEGYWDEYRRYVAAQTAKPDYDAPAEWRYDDGN